MPKTNIEVSLIGKDGNAFAVMGAVIQALKRGGRQDLVEPYQNEAMAGDYNHLLRTTMEYVEVT